MSGDGVVGNALAGLADAATGNLTAAGNRFAPEPVPQLAGRPETVAVAAEWAAPRPPGGGQVTVSRDVLRTVAAAMRSDLTELDAAISRLRAAGAGVASLRGWPTADAFRGNATNAHDGCLAAAVQAGSAHRAAAGNLSGSAAAYDVAESDSTQAVRGVAAAVGGQGR